MKINNLSFIYSIIISSFFLCSCDRKVGFVKPEFNSKINFVRIDKELYDAYPNEINGLSDSMLQKFKGFYSFYFQNVLNEGSPYTLKANEDLAFFLKHPHVRQIEDDIHETFNDLSFLKKEIIKGFNYYNTLFNSQYQPAVVTINSAGNYGVIVQDSVIFIGLDMYVGVNKVSVKDNASFPEYIKVKMDEKYLTSDFFLNIIAENHYQEPKQNNFLSIIVAYGKLMAVLQRVLPDNKPSVLLKYSKEEYDWVQTNQYSIWEFIVKNKMLFSNDNSIINGWINEAPYTNSLGSDSPSRIGVYLGWMIVEDYISENNLTIEDLLNSQDIQKILAAYKPKK